MNTSLSLSKKLFIFIICLLVLTVLPLLYIAERALYEFGNYATSANEKQLSQMAHSYLTETAVTIADKYNERFRRIKSASFLMGAHMSNIYENMEILSKNPLGEIPPMILNPENNMFHNQEHDPVAIVYWGGQTISRNIQKEINALTHYKPTLIKAKQIFEACLATHVITKTGLGYYCTMNMKAKAKAFNLPHPSEFDIRDGEPMTTFTRAGEKIYETKWTNIYKDDVIDGLMMTATTPVYGADGELNAVTGIDFPVDDIVTGLSTTLNKFTDSPNSFALLQNDKGNLLAFPKKIQTLLEINLGLTSMHNSNDIFTVGLKNSENESIRSIADQLILAHNGIFEINLQGKTYLLAIGCLEDIEWHVILVVKKSDILISVKKTADALQKTHRSVWENFIGYSLLILVIACCVGLYAAKVFITPIKAFIKITEKIAQNDFSPNLEISREDEIGILSQSLNSMAEQLKSSNRLRDEYSDKLEKEVKLRTSELEIANNELQKIKKELEKKVEKKTKLLKRLNQHLLDTGENERKSIAADLHDSVAQTLALSIGKLKSLNELGSPIKKESISEVKNQLEQAIHEIRLMIYQLRPPVLDDFDIDIALGQLIKGYQDNNRCRIKYVKNAVDGIKTSLTIRYAAYRITNELIVNILKHSKADNASVKVSIMKMGLCVEVEDNGIGFDWEKIKETKLSAIGLFNISEQVKNLNGTFRVDSKPQRGTRIVFTIPVSQESLNRI